MYVSASVGGRSSAGNCPGTLGSLDSCSIHISMYVTTCMHNLLMMSAPPPRSVGWGIVWKLLLSRLGLFKELFSGAEGREVEKRQAKKTVQIHSPRTNYGAVAHADTTQRRPVDTARRKTQMVKSLQPLYTTQSHKNLVTHSTGRI